MDSIKRDKRNFFFAYNMIFDLPISGNAKLVYLCLCRFADSDNKSFPSHASIGKKCGIKSRTTVISAIEALMEAGLLDYITRTDDKSGGKTSNLYTIYNEPNEDVIKKHSCKQQSDDQPGGPPCSINEHTLCSANEHTPCSINEQPHVHQMNNPCSPNEQPHVHQMNNPCSADEHKKYPIKNTHLKNTQSINQDGQTDPENTDSLFNKIGVNYLHHTDHIGYVRTVISDMFRTGKVGKTQMSKKEIYSSLKNLTPNIMDAVLDRFLEQVTQHRVPRPMEYLKSCLLSAGCDAALQKSAENAAGKFKSSYDIAEYASLSMHRLLESEV